MELLIVIMIIGIVYTLAVNSFTKLSDKNSRVTLLNLKEYLHSFPHLKSVELLCLDDCSSCDVFVDSNKSATIENFLDESVKIYRYDTLYGYSEAQKNVYFNVDDVEEDVCFSYEITKDGVGDQVLVEFKNKYYDFSTYFSEVIAYSSIQNALEAKENLVNEVMR